MEINFGVIVYDRIKPIRYFLHAWKQLNLPIVVIQNGYCQEQKYNILSFSPTYFVQRDNTGMDIGAFQYFVKNFQADYYYWFTDDMLPMKKNFLSFMPQKDLVGQCWAEKRMRTTALGMTKEVAKEMLDYQVITRQDCISFEYYLYERVQNLGCEVYPVGPVGVNCKDFFRTWMWDCHRDSYMNLWEDYYKEFGDPFSIKLL